MTEWDKYVDDIFRDLRDCLRNRIHRDDFSRDKHIELEITTDPKENLMNKSPQYIPYVEHIMWQPTNSCRNHCKGCYVSEFTKTSTETHNTDILELIFETKEVQCLQFTISLDTLNFATDYKWLLNPIKELWEKYNQRTDIALPDLCVTAKNWNTILLWLRALEMSPQSFLAPLEVLSLSKFPVLGKHCAEIQEICEQTKTILNFNYLARGNEDTNRFFTMGLNYCDQMYLVLEKVSLGQEVNPQQMINWLKARKYAKSIAPSKVVEDTCVLNTLHSNTTGICCSVSEKRIQVWPDGSVTGCPYDATHLAEIKIQDEVYGQKTSSTYQEILQVLQSKVEYSLKYCNITKGLNLLQQGTKKMGSLIANERN